MSDSGREFLGPAERLAWLIESDLLRDEQPTSEEVRRELAAHDTTPEQFAAAVRAHFSEPNASAYAKEQARSTSPGVAKVIREAGRLWHEIVNVRLGLLQPGLDLAGSTLDIAPAPERYLWWAISVDELLDASVSVKPSWIADKLLIEYSQLDVAEGGGAAYNIEIDTVEEERNAPDHAVRIALRDALGHEQSLILTAKHNSGLVVGLAADWTTLGISLSVEGGDDQDANSTT